MYGLYFLNNREHHYVPQFYLKSFSCLPKRIHLYNLNRNLAIKGVSIKNQCRRKHFYGENNEVEKSLADLENIIALSLKYILNNMKVPEKNGEHIPLYLFVALQLLRTKRSANKINQLIDIIHKKVLTLDSKFNDVDIEEYEFGYDTPSIMSLKLLPEMAEAIDDLDMHLVIIKNNRSFITSDNPVIRYNQYCEGIPDVGTNGGLSRGLQIFLPLSPKLLLILYDENIYKVSSKKLLMSNSATNNDIESLNLFQVISAEDNLYFSEWDEKDKIKKLVAQSESVDSLDDIQEKEYAEVGNEDKSRIIQTFELVPNMKLNLSFLKVRREASRIPNKSRIRQLRKRLPKKYYRDQDDERESEIRYYRPIS